MGRFVVQRHPARRLHFELGLELGGALLRWGVPRGPSLVPGERRLAVENEDQPVDRRRVEVWDQGEWEPIGDAHLGLARGSLHFRLHGERLDGEWRLLREADSPPGQPRSWSLIRSPERIVDPPEPMLATLVTEPPEGDGWLHEVKHDGYRLRCVLGGGRVRLLSRGDQDWTARFPTVAAAALELDARSATLDGEVVVLDAEGRSSFARLQRVTIDTEVRYIVFDLLELDGTDLAPRPLIERKRALRRLLPRDDVLRYSPYIEGRGDEMLAEACRAGAEGVVSKRRDDPYQPGRGKSWLKCKCQNRQELVVVGFTEPKGGRHGLGAVLLAARDEGRLRYAGRVDTGLSDADLVELRARLDRIRTADPLVEGVPRPIAGSAQWVRPELVAEIAFRDWTRAGQVRHPAFLGLRDDKAPAEVRPERPAALLTHPDKLLFAEAGVSKRELAEYVEEAAPSLLPGLLGRPLTVVRCPVGVPGGCFYQKHATAAMPAQVPRVVVNEREAPYVVVDGVPALQALVQLCVLELQVWGARVDDLERPDQLVFELDPAESVAWSRVVEAAQRVRARLAELGLAAFPRVTGGKGMHVVAPLTPSAGWEEVKALSRAVAVNLVRDDPSGLTAESSKRRRREKIFVDHLRNARGATVVASYSTRARPDATVAMPLRWDQLDDRGDVPRFGLRRARWWMATAPEPWPDFEDARRPITRATWAALGGEVAADDLPAEPWLASQLARPHE